MINNEENITTQDIFSTKLYITTLNVDVQKIAQYCYSLKNSTEGRKRTNRGGFQSNDLKGEIPELNDVFIGIEDAIIDYTQNYLGMSVRKPQTIGNIWVNINGYKDFNSAHVHTYSFVSGTFYVQTPPDCGKIAFKSAMHDHIEQWWWPAYDDDFLKSGNTPPKSDLNYCNNIWSVPPEPAKLVLFPSFLSHYVEPNYNKEIDRISISFNSEFKK